MKTLLRIGAILLVIAFVRVLLGGLAYLMGPPGYVAGGLPPSVTVIATDPGLDANLGDYQSVYVRLAYHTTQEVYLNLDGVSGGRVVRREMTGGMHRAQPGAGEAILWIAFPAGTSLDALRVSVLDLRERPVSSSDLPARLDWSPGKARNLDVRSDWVQRMRAEQQAPTPTSPPSTIEVVLGMGLLGGVPLLYLVLQAWFGIAWNDGWRRTALFPLALAVPAVLWSAYAAADNSNLAFLPIALMAPLGVIYLLVAAALRFVSRRATA